MNFTKLNLDDKNLKKFPAKEENCQRFFQKSQLKISAIIKADKFLVQDFQLTNRVFLFE